MKMRLTNCIAAMCCVLLGCTGPSPRRRARNDAAARDSNAREGPSAPSSAQEPAGRKEPPGNSEVRTKPAEAVPAKNTRSAEPVTFRGKAMSLETKVAEEWHPRQDKTDIDYLFTTDGTAKLAHQLKSEEELISEYKSRVKSLLAEKNS
jgi:hypothetical protein